MFRRQRIPGLSYIPVDNINDPESVPCLAFNLTKFTIPGPHKYGNCRRVTEFKKLRKISDGEFGTIYKVRDTANGEIYALKRLKIRKVKPQNPRGMSQDYLRHITNLRIVKHLNIVNLKEVAVGRHLESNYLVLDFCEYSLENVIEEVNMVFFQHQHIKNVMQQLLFGLQYMHRFNIIHRDLCPRNVLFTDTAVLKICDFGSTRFASDVPMTPNKGMRWYRAPEILFGSRKYTKAGDIWAVGLIFGEMIRQKPLMLGDSEGDIVRSMIKLLGSPTERQWPGYSDLPVPRLYHLRRQPYNRIRPVFSNQTIATVNYLQRFLKYNPVSRPTVEDAMEDAYYIEHPRRCSNEALVMPLRLSHRL